MHRTEYRLLPRSYGSRGGRLIHFDMTVEHRGKPLGGNNVQAVLGAPGELQRGLDENVALTLASGWWVTFRNQFALAPCVGVEILNSVKDSLAEVTAEANETSGEASEELRQKLSSRVFVANGPDYWP
jgi:hypothetical protein